MKSSHHKVLLKINGLKTYFFTDRGVVHAVDDMSICLHEQETHAIVGESGCGKSVTALSILKLIPDPPGKIVGGEILFSSNGDLNKYSESAMRKIRGNKISMIFQEPMTSLNPVFRIGFQIAETIHLHQGLNKKDSMRRSVEMLKMVGIPSPEKRVNDFPHQLSGGMRQRVMIAMAMACKPSLILADEPTTALDVTIQAQILDLMNKLKEEAGTSIILITHNLGVVAEMAQRVSVMYAGVVMESADVRTLFANPLHPYTLGLLTSIPRVDRRASVKKRLNTIPGIVPNLLDLPLGCRFSDRCSRVHDPCRKWEPPLASSADVSASDHVVRCWLYSKSPMTDQPDRIQPNGQ